MAEAMGSQVALVTGSATGIGRATALLLAQRGMAVAVDYSRSEKEAKERLEDGTTVGEVPIKFQGIAPAARRRWREAGVGRRATTLHGSVVITNDYALAGDVCSFSPDFAEMRSHNFDPTLME